MSNQLTTDGPASIKSNEPSDDKAAVGTIKRTAEKVSNIVPHNKISKILHSYDSISESLNFCLEKSILNEHLTNDVFISDFNASWVKQDFVKLDLSKKTTLYKEPFEICVIQDFLQNENMISQLVNEMSLLDWQHKQMDLYEYYQTDDLSNLTLPYMEKFYKQMKLEVIPWIEKLCSINITHTSASCSMYNCGDHLLVHDDLLTDRRIAYVFYLSPWENANEWTGAMGGALELFSHGPDGQPIFPVVQKISPKNNQFIFFKVSQKSFHQVGEVTNFVYPRLTINGWFHGPNEENISETKLSESVMTNNFISPNSEEIILSEWINCDYLNNDIKKSIQKQIELKSEVSLERFFITHFFDLLQAELKSSDSLQWLLQGPANRRNYESLCIESCKGPIKDFVTLLLSQSMFNILHEYTELDLAGSNAKNPTCFVDICRMKQGCYSLLGDPTEYTDSSLDIILFCNAKDHIGVITYLNPEGNIEHLTGETYSDEEEDDDNNVLLTLHPANNALNLVYRSDGTAKFIKYISKNFIFSDEYVYMVIASYKE